LAAALNRVFGDAAVWWIRNLGYAALLIFGSLIVLFPILYVIGRVQDRRRKAAVREWQEAYGTIETAELRDEGVQITYSYVFGGQRYGGVWFECLDSDQGAQESAAAVHSGSELLIKVNPERPQKSVFVKLMNEGINAR
jgi:hypothetical protein